MKRKNMLLSLTAITTGLMAGLFFSWSFSVTPGLARLPDREYIAAMQSMNKAILNPVFFSCFFGAAILLPLSAFTQYQHPTRFWLLLGASIMYIGGVIAVTARGNVPLNKALDIFDLRSAPVAEINRQRIAFETPWNKLSNIRTIASVLALLLVIIACLNASNAENR